MCRFANTVEALQESRGVSDAVPSTKSVPSGDSEAVAGQCRERGDSSNEQETEQLIARVHAAMAEDCDCPQHRTATGDKLDPGVNHRILTAIRQDQTFASLTTVRAAIYDVIDKGSFSGWWELYDEGDNPEVTEDMVNQERCDFVDAVCARTLALQREPHGMDAGLRVAATALRQRESEVRAEAWQPIESAPKDGTTVLLVWHWNSGALNGTNVIMAHWGCRVHEHLSRHCDCPNEPDCRMSWGTYSSDYGNSFSHWMPMPDLPAAIRRHCEAQEGEQR
jgi:hypothetical protein